MYTTTQAICAAIYVLRAQGKPVKQEHVTALLWEHGAGYVCTLAERLEWDFGGRDSKGGG